MTELHFTQPQMIVIRCSVLPHLFISWCVIPATDKSIEIYQWPAVLQLQALQVSHYISNILCRAQL